MSPRKKRRYRKPTWYQKPKTSRGDHQKWHTMKNFWTRYGIRLTEIEYRFLVGQIRNGKINTFAYQINKRLKNHVVMLHGEKYLVGYDKKTKQLATVLPAACLVRFAVAA